MSEETPDRDEAGHYLPGHSQGGPGRPTLYKDEYAEQAEKLCKLGATDYELADFFGVETSTIWRWRYKHPAFCSAVKENKENADKRVQRSLYNRSVGYTFESEKVFMYQGEVVRAKTVEHVPPDPSAAMNWLKNRKPEEWRDKQEVEGTMNHVHNISEQGQEIFDSMIGKRASD